MDKKESRSSTFWFDDGSVIFEVLDGRYRIHQSILRSQSEVFNDMFQIPPSFKNGDVIDGLPIVKLAGDTTEDWTALLGALYQVSYFDDMANQLSKLSLEALTCACGILRLSTKYRFGTLRKMAIKALRIISPASFDEMIRRVTVEDGRRFETALEVGSVAIECKAPTLLPAALFQVCQSLPSNGIDDRLFVDSEKLPFNVKAWCLSGRTRLFFAQEKDKTTSLAFHDLETNLVDSKSIRQCQKTSKSEYMCYLPSFGPPKVPGIWALHALNDEWKDSSKCHRCMTKVQELYRARQGVIWSQLPSYFGVGTSWEELEKLEDEY